MNQTLAHTLRSLQRNILAGIITIAPLFVTYLIFSFLLGILAKAGLPLVWVLAYLLPEAKVNTPWVQFLLAILLTLVVLYVVGRVTSQVLGRRALALFEAFLDRVPFVAKIYGSVRQLVDNMTTPKETSQRVVLVDFPVPGQKCIGFLGRVMTDSATGEPIAAVMLPNAINPTSAILQLVPLRNVTETDMTMEQAMSMLLTGGAVGPETLRFYGPEAAVSRDLPAAGLAEMAVIAAAIVDAPAAADAPRPAPPPAGRPLP